MIAFNRASHLAGFILLFSSVGMADEVASGATRQAALGDLKMLIETARSAWAYAEDKRENFGVNLDQLNTLAASQSGTAGIKAKLLRFFAAS